LKLYKFRSLSNDGLFYTLDMIIHNRLYLSTRDKVNDINEGQWNSKYEITGRKNHDNLEINKKLKSIIDKQRFTCLVQNIDIKSHLMWAHYAGGFSGVALEFEVDECKYDLRKVEYLGTPDISIEEANKVVLGEIKPQDIGLLRRKDKCWEYEGEWRLYGQGQEIYVTDIKPTAVILGPKEGTKHHSLLKPILKKFNIPIGYMVPSSNSEFEIEIES